MVARKTPLAKVCPHCEAEFQTYFGQAVYCGEKCRSLAHYYRKREPLMQDRPCERCGQTFTPKTLESRYCSDKCIHAAVYQRKQAPHRNRQAERFLAEDNRGEEWRVVSGFDAYEVSDQGRVRNTKTLRYQRPRLSIKGRPYVDLWQMDVGHRVYPHRLVLETFVGPCPEGMQACHNDGNKENNRLENLRWDTASANQLDREEHGTSNIGQQNPRAKLTNDQTRELRAKYASGRYSGADLAAEYGIARSTVYNIVHGRSWRKV